MNRVASVNCTRVRFEAGDRVLVRLLRPMSVDQKKRLVDAIKRWAGVSVEVLVYDPTSLSIEVEKGTTQL